MEPGFPGSTSGWVDRQKSLPVPDDFQFVLDNDRKVEAREKYIHLCCGDVGERRNVLNHIVTISISLNVMGMAMRIEF